MAEDSHLVQSLALYAIALFVLYQVLKVAYSKCLENFLPDEEVSHKRRYVAGAVSAVEAEGGVDQRDPRPPRRLLPHTLLVRHH